MYEMMYMIPKAASKALPSKAAGDGARALRALNRVVCSKKPRPNKRGQIITDTSSGLISKVTLRKKVSIAPSIANSP